jgi:hypothetical protein
LRSRSPWSVFPCLPFPPIQIYIIYDPFPAISGRFQLPHLPPFTPLLAGVPRTWPEPLITKQGDQRVLSLVCLLTLLAPYTGLKCITAHIPPKDIHTNSFFSPSLPDDIGHGGAAYMQLIHLPLPPKEIITQLVGKKKGRTRLNRTLTSLLPRTLHRPRQTTVHLTVHLVSSTLDQHVRTLSSVCLGQTKMHMVFGLCLSQTNQSTHYLLSAQDRQKV